MLKRLRTLIASSLRYKLLLLVLFPILAFGPAAIGFALYWSRDFNDEQLFHKVNTDLAVAHDVFDRLQRDFLFKLESLADSYAFRTALANDDQPRLRDQLRTMAETARFSFLHLTDVRGHWLLGGPTSVIASSKPSPLLQRAAQWGVAGVGVEVYRPGELLSEGEALARRAQIPLIETPRTEPTDRRVEDRGLVLRAIAPVRSPRGEVVALLDAGVLLNRNFDVVDRVRDLVYGPGSLAEGSIGTVAVFIGDVRISTNVPLRAGERAVGTRVSSDLRERVLEQGHTWIDRAFVVNDWYISAHEPVVDVYGRRIGMLYVGYLEAPYRDAWHSAALALLGLLLLGTLLAALVAIRGAKSIFKPVEAMAAVVRATQAGQEMRIGPVAARDEIGELAHQLDAMLDLLKLRSDQIRFAAGRLESKVEERTAELKAKNQRLEETIGLLYQTRRQLVEAEKLAAIGELTAGVAHEINNPTAVILGNIELIRAELGDAVAPVDTEVELIIEQTSRIRAIVDKLLRFARPSQFTGDVHAVAVREVVEDCLVLLRHELERKAVTVHCDLTETLTVAIDRGELQQVLVNLLMNAVQAVASGGRVDIVTRDWHARGVVITVADDGPGIARAHQHRVFDPFFSTKEDSGTGLGLSVSYGLVRRYGGDIALRSEPGAGAAFDVYLLQEPVLEDADPMRAPPPAATLGAGSMR